MFDSALFGQHLEDDEKVTVVVHKHWLIGVKELVFPTISVLLGLGFLSVARTTVAFYIVASWVGMSLVWWMRNFFDYYLDAWIVTNEGIIDLEWHGWFHRQASRILYSDIQGVSYEIKGVIGTILRYGELSVEKISTGAAVSLPNVPRPRSVEAVILKNMEAYLHTKNMKDSKHVQEILAGIVAGQVQMKAMEKGDASEEFAVEEGIIVKKKPAAPQKKKAGFSSAKIRSRD